MPRKGALMDEFSGSSPRDACSLKRHLFASHHFSSFPFCPGPLDSREMSGGPGDKLEEQAPWREDLGVVMGLGILHWESGDPRSRAALPPSVVCSRRSLLFSRPRSVPCTTRGEMPGSKSPLCGPRPVRVRGMEESGRGLSGLVVS